MQATYWSAGVFVASSLASFAVVRPLVCRLIRGKEKPDAT